MGKYDNNTATIEYPSGITIFSCTNNSGKMRVLDDSTIFKCAHNSGFMYFGKRSKIDKIVGNRSDIHVDDYSTVSLIKKNEGHVYLGRFCKVEAVVENGGFIIANPGSDLPRSPGCGGIVKVRDKDYPLGPAPLRSPPPRRRSYLESIIAGSSSTAGANFEDNTCSICLNNRRNTAFTCGHVCYDTCAEALTTCHFCRKEITERIRLYL